MRGQLHLDNLTVSGYRAAEVATADLGAVFHLGSRRQTVDRGDQ
jgi:hypothetical protein